MRTAYDDQTTRRRRVWRTDLSSVFFGVCLFVAPTVAQPGAGSSAAQQQVTMRRIAAAPVFEAFVPRHLSPETVAGLTLVTGFTQREPQDGAPANQKTEVYLGYDATHFHAVFRAFEGAPEKIRAHLNRRDNVGDDDHVTLLLDTFGDRRRGYVFRSNPLGVQYDAAAAGGERWDSTFDAVWPSRGRLTDWGYLVTMSIPFKSMRFERSADWGIILLRERPREIEEELTWPWISSALAGFIDQAAVLRGVDAETRSRNYQVIPYASFRTLSLLEQSEDGSERLTSQGSDFDGGADFKAVFNDRFVLDATINPDFSQIESDEPQATVNQRFEVFFPERRPFFLENSDFFDSPINLVFTRRILDPSVGTRLTGKLGRYSIGALVTDDEGPGRSISDGVGASENAFVGVARIKRDVGEQSSLGLLATYRDFADQTNVTVAVDGRFRLAPKWDSEFQVAGSETKMLDGSSERGEAIVAEVERSGRHLNFDAELRSVDENFRPALGFLRRRDVREVSSSMSRAWRPVGKRRVRSEPEIDVLYRTDQSGFWLDRQIELGFESEWQNETQLEVKYEQGKERLRPGDADGVERMLEFDTHKWEIELSTTPSSSFDIEGSLFSARTINFEQLDGREPTLADELGAEVEFTLRPIVPLRIDSTILVTRLEDRDSGAALFDDWIVRTRWNWQVSLPFTVRVILQWEETSPDTLLTPLEPEEGVSADVLLSYRFNPWTAIHLGYTENRSTLFSSVNGEIDLRDRRDPRVIDRLAKDGEQVFVKVSYLIW